MLLNEKQIQGGGEGPGGVGQSPGLRSHLGHHLGVTSVE